TSYLVPCRPPPLFYMAQCDGGPPAIGLGAPDQGAVKAPLSRWAQGEGDLSNKESHAKHRTGKMIDILLIYLLDPSTSSM
ncbi:Os04g0372201, partial [Oryza sativa Japonica Group]